MPKPRTPSSLQGWQGISGASPSLRGATSYAEVGEFVTKHNGDFAVNPTVAKFFDYEAFGEHISELYHGEFVGDGFIYNDTDTSLLDILYQDEPMTMGGM